MNFSEQPIVARDALVRALINFHVIFPEFVFAIGVVSSSRNVEM